MAYYGIRPLVPQPTVNPQVMQLLPLLLAMQQDERADSRYQDGLDAIMKISERSEAGRNEARAANEERYNTILDRDLDTRNRLLDYLKGYGESMEADINQNFGDNLQNSLAQLSRSGLLGSTVRSSVEARNEKERTDALRRLKDNLTQNAIGVDERTSNRLSDFQERRTDAYPDDSGVQALIGQIMSTLGGGGGNTVNALAALQAAGGLNGGMSGPMGTQFATQQRPPTQAQWRYSGGPAPASQQAPHTALLKGGLRPEQRDSLAYDEQRRRNAMANLYDAGNVGGLEGEARVREALSQLTRMGYAQPHPNAGVPAVEPPQPSGRYETFGGNGYQPDGDNVQGAPAGYYISPDDRQARIQQLRQRRLGRITPRTRDWPQAKMPAQTQPTPSANPWPQLPVSPPTSWYDIPNLPFANYV